MTRVLAVDVQNKAVKTTTVLNTPGLASHYATCGGSEGPLGVGGAMVVSSGFGRHAVVVGSVELATGGFVPIDSALLPAAGPAAVPTFLQSWRTCRPSPCPVHVQSGFNRLPGKLFVAYPDNGRGTATQAPLQVLVYGLAEVF